MWGGGFAGLEDGGGVAEGFLVDACGFVLSLLGCEGAGALLEVFEFTEVPALYVLWVLERNNVFAPEFLVAD